MVSFPQASPPTPCAHLSPPPYAPHAQPISFLMKTDIEQKIRTEKGVVNKNSNAYRG
jgi:hypothetical protein